MVFIFFKNSLDVLFRVSDLLSSAWHAVLFIYYVLEK